jgi:hypothetical protein
MRERMSQRRSDASAVAIKERRALRTVALSLSLLGLLALAAGPAGAAAGKTRIVWSRFEHKRGDQLQLI